MKKYSKKPKTININLTEEEYEKVKQLAEIRNLNPTSYARLVSLGNRIKPTVIQDPNDKNKEYAEVLKQFVECVNKKGFIDFQKYKQNKELVNQIVMIKQELENH